MALIAGFPASGHSSRKASKCLISGCEVSTKRGWGVDECYVIGSVF